MKPEKIITALNDIDGQFIREARETTAASRKSTRRFAVLIAAVIALMAITVTAFASEQIADWFQMFLGGRFVPESWQDASEKEDYSVELLTEPVSGIPAYEFDGDGVIDITVISVRLRPGSLVMMYHATDSESLFDHYPGGVKVVTLNSDEIMLALSGVGRISEEEDSLYWVEYAADVPPIDKIDYVELFDGTRLMVP